MSLNSLREDAWAIWQAGLEAVRSDRLVRDWVRVSDDELRIGRDPDGTVRIERALLGHVVVVGAGKAGAGMAEGLETALGDAFLHGHHVTGWLNVPADCVRELSRIILHAARPAGVNEPTEAGAAGAERILQMVGGLSENDLVICLLSGGGSALLPSPVPGISLADKQQVTRLLSGAGANIEQLNTVRKQLSGIKGGGLARACRAGRLVTLIISDVLGDPLDVIASGPTVPDSSTPADALRVLEQFATDPSRV
ncbi:MAG: glycerate-2-kinase family protein, partial [Planctomycetales bacterium]|nr:glycerate-2-kinase family protein [Planctomycetales bacterium]